MASSSSTSEKPCEITSDRVSGPYALEQRLRRSSTPLTASACFEVLRECRLNLLRVAPETPTQYRLTDPSSEQRAILHNLRLADLLDEEVVQAQLRPRDAA